MADSGRNATKKHITTACTCCRRRKVKCDGSSPTCSNCKLYNQVCKYNYSDDRRKISSKQQIEHLSKWIQFLEDLLRSNNIEIPLENDESSSTNEEPTGDASKAAPNPSADQESPPRARENGHVAIAASSKMGLQAIPSTSNSLSNLPPMDFAGDDCEQRLSSSWGAFMLPPNGTQMQMPPPKRGTTADVTWPWLAQQPNIDVDTIVNDIAVQFDDEESSNSPAKDLHGGSALYGPPLGLRRQSSIEWHDDNTWAVVNDGSNTPQTESQPEEEMIDQLSARMGSFQIAEDGQLRYFGATSNLHILHNGASSLSRTPPRSVRIEGRLALERAGIAQEIPLAFEQHLEKLYFTWEDPAIHVVDEEMYYRQKAAYEDAEESTSFYSESLKNAICAIGANLNSKACRGLPEQVPEFFSSRAKALLDIELDSPTVATVQALVIMSASEAAFTRDARGWLYSGMAVRISADLGLHLDVTKQVQDGKITQQELDVRRTTFWGVFVHDNMWSLYVGRPWGINIRDISISRPMWDQDKLRNRVWKPYSGETDFGAPEFNDNRYYDPVEACADSNVSLCAMMRRLSRTLYAGRTFSDDELTKFASDMRDEFNIWHNSLPKELTVDMLQGDRMHLPHVLQLHMQFNVMSIFLHRPFFSRRFRNQHISFKAQRACTEAAQSTLKLLQIYRKQHTLRRCNVQIVHLLFTASFMQIYNTCSASGKAAEVAMADLQFCCQALGEIGVAYKSSTRALEVIICIRLEWQRTRNTLKLKRPLSSLDANGSGTRMAEQRKRRATTDNGLAANDTGLPSINDGILHSRSGRDEGDIWLNMHQSDQDMGQWGNEYPVLGTFPDSSFAYTLFQNVIPNSIE